jgi:hypothetical protein
LPIRVGATGDTGRYSITGDTYQLDQATKVWKKIEGTVLLQNSSHGIITVATSSACLCQCRDQPDRYLWRSNWRLLIPFLTLGGSLASDDLYLLDLRAADGILSHSNGRHRNLACGTCCRYYAWPTLRPHTDLHEALPHCYWWQYRSRASQRLLYP